jgi:hypothetical protein
MLMSRLCLALCALMLIAPAVAIAKSGKLEAADRNAELAKPEYYGPKAPFDPADARAKLAEGDVTIRGFLFHNLNGWGRPGTLFLPGGPAQAVKNVEVYLYPATAHLVEWQKLFEKENSAKFKPPIVAAFQKRKRPKVLEFDPRMQEVRIIVKTDEFGRFTFEKMRPGKYYITAATNISGSYEGNEVTGHSTAYDGWGRPYNVEHTRPATHSFSTPMFMDDFIEVKDDETKMEIDAKMKTNYAPAP